MKIFSLVAATLALTPAIDAYPWMGRLSSRQPVTNGTIKLSQRAASPPTSQYPYTGAKIDGLPGTGIGGIPVPAPGDTAHEYQDPPAGAQRGPCPGMNTLANHGFISRDGITTFDELVAAQQNVFNAGWDLSVVLAVLGVALDGDIVTEKMSIGGDATNQTSPIGGILGKEGGLDTHNTFESDTSLTRMDYFTNNGDDFSFIGEYFKQMTDTVSTTSSASNPLYDFKGLATYRGQTYDRSKSSNPNFYFGPKTVLLYGAASFLYELFPSQANNLTPDKATISSFYGAHKNGDGTYSSIPERIPPGWTNRKTPYLVADTAVQILSMYLAHPVLFGGNTGNGSFDVLPDFGVIKSGKLASSLSATDITCLIYQLVVSDDVPDSLSGVITLPLEILTWALGKLNPVFGKLECPLRTVP